MHPHKIRRLLPRAPRKTRDERNEENKTCSFACDAEAREQVAGFRVTPKPSANV